MLKKLKGLGLGLLFAAVAYCQVPVKVTNGSGTERPLGAAGTEYKAYLQVIATGGTTITSSNTYVTVLFCMNTTGSAATLTIADTQGSPVTFWNAVSIAANSVVLLYTGPIGLYMQGIKATAGTGSALYCQVQGVQ